MNEEIELILKANQLIIRDRIWNDGSNQEKAEVIDEQITDLLNPKQGPSLAERTKEALGSESDEDRAMYDTPMNPELFETGKTTKQDVSLGSSEGGKK